MIEARVRVISATDGMTWVSSSEASGCGACQSQSSCGISGLGKYLSRRRHTMSLAHADARPGDELMLCVDESELLRAGLFAYLLPALLAVIGAALADSAGATDPAAAFAALLGFISGLLAARFLAPTPHIQTSPINTDFSGEPS
ncbi:MAG: SoxR reducing system RseC family protein [Gammaproteobacteria bacterium]|nr:SoxR reducing system RseC family protein [Gammaproteobacteria bacterium]